MASPDLAIVGLGAMGAAAAWQATAAGLSVVGFDALAPPHTTGSTHGRSRIIREAYFEHPQYVPLVQRAYQLWADLEARARTRLFVPTGGLMIGHEDGVVVAGTRRAAAEHGLAVQVWSRDEIRTRVPPLGPAPGMIGVFEPRAGVLAPERAVEAMLALASGAGAALHVNEPVVGWDVSSAGVTLSTASRAVTARHLLIAAGPWTAGVLGGLKLPLEVERVVQYWYAPGAGRRFEPGVFPVFLLETPDGRMLYGLPDQGQGLKLAEHHNGAMVDLDRVERTVSASERGAFHAWASGWVAGLAPAPADAHVCLYTNTPDGDFVLDWHPQAPQVLICSACSGHGFKFAPAIGEAIASLVARGDCALDVSPFGVARLIPA